MFICSSSNLKLALSQEAINDHAEILCEQRPAASAICKRERRGVSQAPRPAAFALQESLRDDGRNSLSWRQRVLEAVMEFFTDEYDAIEYVECVGGVLSSVGKEKCKLAT
jgi:hypothetical protein